MLFETFQFVVHIYFYCLIKVEKSLMMSFHVITQIIRVTSNTDDINPYLFHVLPPKLGQYSDSGQIKYRTD